MRNPWTRRLAVLLAGALLLGACSDGDDQAQEDEVAQPGDEEIDEEALEELLEDQQDMPDPNADVEDGVYSGNGVLLPVPDGWSLAPEALAQGLVAAVTEDGMQQLTAQAVDTEDAAAAGQDLDLDTLLDGVRQQAPQEPDVDEETDLAGATRAHRLTFTGVQAVEEGAPESSTTIVLAEDGEGLLAEFTFTAAVDAYDEETVDLLLAEAGFDPDSEPQPMPQQPAPPPQGNSGGQGDG